MLHTVCIWLDLKSPFFAAYVASYVFMGTLKCIWAKDSAQVDIAIIWKLLPAAHKCYRKRFEYMHIYFEWRYVCMCWKKGKRFPAIYPRNDIVLHDWHCTNRCHGTHYCVSRICKDVVSHDVFLNGERVNESSVKSKTQCTCTYCFLGICIVWMIGLTRASWSAHWVQLFSYCILRAEALSPSSLHFKADAKIACELHELSFWYASNAPTVNNGTN